MATRDPPKGVKIGQGRIPFHFLLRGKYERKTLQLIKAPPWSFTTIKIS